LRGIFVCEKVPLVYYNVPKCACTTIKNVMYYLDSGDWFDEPLNIHRHVSRGKALLNRMRREELLAAMASRAISFTFVRHPLKRTYSCFNEKIYYQSPHSFSKLRNGVLKKRYGIRFPQEGQAYSAADHGENFRRFLAFVEQNVAGDTAVRRDPHWLPQSELLKRQRHRGEVDFVGRLESYAQDMTFILQKAGVDATEALVGKRFNEGLPPPYTLQEVLNDDVLDLGERVFADDYERFAYALHPRG
jgi:hypothetical protein